MPLIPSFFSDFQCTAARCQHNCCIGWEIDIDAETLQKYCCLPGPLGERLQQNIENGPPAHFRLSENGRCPMLENDGLCSLQKEYGEEMICQICRDHPRYRVYLPGRTEEGLGLCCEEAARLLLTNKSEITWEKASSAALPAKTAFLLKRRQRLIDIAQDHSLTLAVKFRKILLFAGANLRQRNREEICEWMLTLEPLDKDWPQLWKTLEKTSIHYGDFDEYMLGRETEYEHLLVYFLLRHYLAASGRQLAQRAAFAVFSTSLLYTLGAAEFSQKGMFPLSAQIELCRKWSANVEYSEENMQNILQNI